MIRTYVFYGQGGLWTSTGMQALANRIRDIPRLGQVSTHSWKDHVAVSRDMLAQPEKTKIAVIGYSLGANAATWAAAGRYGAVYPGNVDLMVLYDPTRHSYMCSIDPNVKKCVHYYNKLPNVWGRAWVNGEHVEHIETYVPHEVMHLFFHDNTIERVKALA